MQPAVAEEARRILREAEVRGITLRLLGGSAVFLRCPSAGSGILARPPPRDIDLAGLKRETAGIRSVFEALGHAPNLSFNALHGYKQLMFHGPGGAPKVDVFLDEFAMCHRLDMRPRLSLSRETLPLADLLFTKMQIVQINEKDLKDIIALLLDFRLDSRDADDSINGAFLADLASKDWGIFTTLTDNLQKAQEFLQELPLDAGATARVAESIGGLRTMMEEAPKGLAWRLRSRVGRRIAWYELPEEPRAIPFGPRPPT